MSSTATPAGPGGSARIGRADVQIVIAGKGLLPTADGTACCSSSSSSIRRGKG